MVPVQAETGLSACSNILPKSAFMAISDIYIAITLLRETAPLYGMVVSNLRQSFEICLILRGGFD